MSRMPEHDFSVAGHRSALLMKFSESGSTGPGGLWTPSMHGNLCAGASTTSGLLQLSSCKIDSNNKSSQQQGGTTAAGQRSQARVATLSTVPARMSSTGDQGGAGGGRGGGDVADVGPPTTSRKVGARSPKISTKRNGRRNPSLSALSEKEPKRKEKEKHNLGSVLVIGFALRVTVCVCVCVCTCLQTEFIDNPPRSSDFIGCWKLALFGYADGKYKLNFLDQW